MGNARAVAVQTCPACNERIDLWRGALPFTELNRSVRVAVRCRLCGAGLVLGVTVLCTVRLPESDVGRETVDRLPRLSAHNAEAVEEDASAAC